MKDTDVILMNKLRDKINDYLANKYSIKTIKHFSEEIKDEYLQALDDVLLDSNNIMFTNFIFPNGKQKRIEFDLSDLHINDAYKSRFNITDETLRERFIIAHESVIYLGFDLEEILLSGCIRVGYNKANKECYLHYDSSLYLPTKQILDTIDEILFTTDTVMLAKGFSNNFKSFSYKNGDTIKDIKRFIIENR